MVLVLTLEDDQVVELLGALDAYETHLQDYSDEPNKAEEIHQLYWHIRRLAHFAGIELPHV